MISKEASSLYIHIPYCQTICNYCDFCKKIYNFQESIIYILDLCKDIRQIKKKYKTIYIGGGTPTCLDDTIFELLIKTVSTILDDDYEFSIEANVENLTKKKLDIMRANKVNRLSIGIQTFNDEHLKIMNRQFKSKQAIETISFAKKYISNVNIDLIYGGFFSTFDDLKNDLNIIKSLDIDHISLYSLAINKNTIFYNLNKKEKSDDFLSEEYEFIRKFLKDIGFEQYEISNFCRNDQFSRHNVVYRENEYYDALGAGAAGYCKNRRYKYTYNVKNYLKYKTLIEDEEVNEEDCFKYEIFLALRLKKGINILKINKKFDIDFLKKYKNKIDKLIKNGFLVLENNFLKCSDKGMFLEEKIFNEIIN